MLPCYLACLFFRFCLRQSGFHLIVSVGIISTTDPNVPSFLMIDSDCSIASENQPKEVPPLHQRWSSVIFLHLIKHCKCMHKFPSLHFPLFCFRISFALKRQICHKKYNAEKRSSSIFVKPTTVNSGNIRFHPFSAVKLTELKNLTFNLIHFNNCNLAFYPQITCSGNFFSQIFNSYPI